MELELSRLRQALNFPNFHKMKSQTLYENWIAETGKTKTWHKIDELVKLLPKSNHVLTMTNQNNTMIYLRDGFPGCDWLLIQEWSHDKKSSWTFKKFAKKCLTGKVKTDEGEFWNNGRIWEEGMVDFFNQILASRNWTADLVFCDMSIINQDLNSQEQDQMIVKTNEWNIACKNLTRGGSLVMKFLGVSNLETRRIILDITSHFLAFDLKKLKGSNPLNSELYLICYNFQLEKIQQNLISQHEIRLEELVQNLILNQISQIKSFLSTCKVVCE